MVKYINCFLGKDGQIHRGLLRKKPETFLDWMFHLFPPEFNSEIILTKKEAIARFGKNYNPKGYAIRTAEGVLIGLKIK